MKMVKDSLLTCHQYNHNACTMNHQWKWDQAKCKFHLATFHSIFKIDLDLAVILRYL